MVGLLYALYWGMIAVTTTHEVRRQVSDFDSSGNIGAVQYFVTLVMVTLWPVYWTIRLTDLVGVKLLPPGGHDI